MRYEAVSANLAPSARQMNLEWGTTLHLGRGESLSANVVHSIHPGHSAQAPDQTFVGATYRVVW